MIYDAADRNSLIQRALLAGDIPARESELSPVMPTAPEETGDIDLPCAHCGKSVFVGWNLSSLLRAESVDCWNCGTHCIEPRVFARIVAIEQARSMNQDCPRYRR